MSSADYLNIGQINIQNGQDSSIEKMQASYHQNQSFKSMDHQ